MTYTSSLSVLDLAARLLAATAQQARAARPSPWKIDPNNTNLGGALLLAANERTVAYRATVEPGAADLPYLALTDPEFGLALAQWLAEEARTERLLDSDDVQRWPSRPGSAGVSSDRHVNLFADNIARLVVAAAERNGLLS